MHLLLVDGLKPFSVLAGFIVVLLVTEIALMLIGLSSNIEVEGAGEGPDVAAGFDAGVYDSITLPETGVLTEAELATLDLPPNAPPRGPSRTARLLRLAGLGHGPLLVSLTCIAAGISSCGYFLQLSLQAATGAMLPAGLALAIALVPGLLLGGRLAAFASRLIPSFESHAISGQTYNGRRGHVVIGEARRGEPAQVRWRDMYGTTHSLMAEPLRDGDTIAANTEVLIVKTKARQPRIVSISAS